MFEVGDVVIPADNRTVLACGSGIYSHAIVIQADPLIIVSEESDMRWSSTVEDMNLTAIGTAKPEVLKHCMRRLES